MARASVPSRSLGHCSTPPSTARSSASADPTRSTRSSTPRTSSSPTTTFRRSQEGADMSRGSKPTIGFVGLGHMGGNMAARFLAADYTVYGEEQSREHAQHLVEQGLRWCDTPREVAEPSDVVFTSLPDDRVLEEVASGADGLLAGIAGKTWVDMST